MSKGGILLRYEHYQYVDEDKIPEDLICSICLDPFVAPIFCQYCRVTFCEKDALQVICCPFCRTPWKQHRYLPVPLVLEQLLDKLQVKCTQRNCAIVMDRKSLSSHLQTVHGIVGNDKPEGHVDCNDIHLKPGQVGCHWTWDFDISAPIQFESKMRYRWFACRRCKYPYAVGECGLPWEPVNCPGCNSALGGNAHR